MPYDKFEQAAPIEVLPNIQPQVDESMIRAVQTASQAFEARAKRKQEEEEAASTRAKAETERKNKLLDFKVPSIDIPAYQKKVSGKANEIIGNAMQGVDSPYLKQEVTDIIKEGESLKNFAQTINPALEQTQKVWGEKNVNITDNIKNFPSKLNDPNKTVEDLQKERQIAAEDLANIPYTLNMAGVASDWIDNRNKNREALDVTFTKTTPTKETSTTTKTKARLWVDTNENMTGVDGKPLIDPSTNQIIKRQKPAETYDEFRSIAPELLQSYDGQYGEILSMQVEKQLGDKLNKETEENLKNLKQTIFSQNIQKGIYTPIDKLMTKEEEQAANDEFRKGYLQEATLNKAVELLQNQQQAHLAGVIAAQKIFATKGGGAGEGEKVAKVTTARNTTYPEIFYNRTTGKIETGVKQTLGEVIFTDKNGRLPVLELDGKVKNVTINDGEILKTPVTTQMIRTIPLVYNKETGAVEHIPEGLNMLQWLQKQTPETLSKLDVQAYAYMKSGIKGKDGLFESSPEMDESKLARYYNLKENKKRTQEEEKEFNELKIEFNSKTRLYRQEYSKIQSKLKASGFDAPEPNNAFYKDPQLQREFEKAKEIIRRGSTQQKTTPTPAKSGGTKGGKTAEKGKIKIVGTKLLVDFNQ